MAIDFSAPPINEVLIGKVYEPRFDLTIPYFGKFWELIEDEFPKCQHAVAIGDSISGGDFQLAVDPALGTVLPRVWFIGNEATRLLQLQQDRFYFDWRQLPDKSSEYIRFKSIFESYRKYEDILSSFVASQLGNNLVPTRYDLTYVNVFKQGSEWSQLSDLSSLLKGFDFISSHKNIGSVGRCAVRLEFKMSNCPGSLNLTILSGRSANPNNTNQNNQLIRMELAATCAVGALSGATEDDWFHLAHEAIVNGFCELTTETAQQRYWKRTS